jgi:hypothetical protein
MFGSIFWRFKWLNLDGIVVLNLIGWFRACSSVLYVPNGSAYKIPDDLNIPDASPKSIYCSLSFSM